MAEPLAVFRADASPGIGGGHVVRCSAIADVLAAQGWRCVFAADAASRAAMHELVGHRHDWVLTEREGEADRLGEALGAPADWLVVDHYGRDATFHRACRHWARRILVIDDLADREFDCDVLVNPVPGYDTRDLAGIVPHKCRLLFGPTHAPLRATFPALRQRALARRHRKREPERVLVSFGSMDSPDFTSIALEGLTRAGFDGRVNVVLGGAAPHLATIRERIAALDLSVSLHVSTPAMADLMASADLAFGSSGMTAWERCCLGLPAVVAVAADNQAGIARALSDAGAAVTIDAGEEVTARNMAEIFMELQADPVRLHNMSDAAAGLCDGGGATRIAQVMTTG